MTCQRANVCVAISVHSRNPVGTRAGALQLVHSVLQPLLAVCPSQRAAILVADTLGVFNVQAFSSRFRHRPEAALARAIKAARPFHDVLECAMGTLPLPLQSRVIKVSWDVATAQPAYKKQVAVLWDAVTQTNHPLSDRVRRVTTLVLASRRPSYKSAAAAAAAPGYQHALAYLVHELPVLLSGCRVGAHVYSDILYPCRPVGGAVVEPPYGAFDVAHDICHAEELRGVKLALGLEPTAGVCIHPVPLCHHT